jgi:hypothetical protein
MLHASGKTHFRKVVTFVGLLVSIPTAVLWSWNIALPELFGAPTMDYRNALGVVILLGLILALGRGGNDFRHRTSR